MDDVETSRGFFPQFDGLFFFFPPPVVYRFRRFFFFLKGKCCILSSLTCQFGVIKRQARAGGLTIWPIVMDALLATQLFSGRHERGTFFCAFLSLEWRGTRDDVVDHFVVCITHLSHL